MSILCSKNLLTTNICKITHLQYYCSMYNHHLAETGHMAELEHLDTVDSEKYIAHLRQTIEELSNDPRRNEEFLKLKSSLEQCRPPYVSRRISIELVKKLQKEGSPSMPSAPYARNLQQAVIKKINADFGLNLTNSHVLFYTACSDTKIRGGKHLNTSADEYHGIDAFFEISLDTRPGSRPGSRPILVTIDGSENTNKEGRRMADHVVTIWPNDLDPRTNVAAYNQFVSEEAQKIVDIVTAYAEQANVGQVGQFSKF